MSGLKKGTRRCKSVAWGLSVVFIIFSVASVAYGEEKIDLPALIQDTQKMAQEPDDMTMVWWMPKEFWRACFSQDSSMSKKDTDEMLATIEPYTMIAVLDGKMGSFGGITYKSEATVRSTTCIKDSNGRRYSALSADKVDADTKNLVQMLKPMLASMIGDMGRNMHFILFPAKGKGGVAIADATKEGSFTVVVGDKEFDYRLPLGSVLPAKHDPKTGESFPGNYHYNPFTGNKLSEK